MTSNALKQIDEHFSPKSSQKLLFRINLSPGTDLSKTQAIQFRLLLLLLLNTVAVMLSVNENKLSSEIQTAPSGDFSYCLHPFQEKTVNDSYLFIRLPHRVFYIVKIWHSKKKNLSNKRKSAACYNCNFRHV